LLGSRALARLCAGSSLVNLELHGMDFLDAADVRRGDLARLQPELGASPAARTERLTAFVEVLRERGLSFVTLREAASIHRSGSA
jgi:peptidoglycan-N-acetylglucosamine deacetylase